jgi:Bacterial SH3 domain
VSHRHVLLLLPVLAAAPATEAETLYVVEQLVVNVNSAPDGSGARIASIKSADAVEVLDSQGEQVHVHLQNGREGWVKRSYLSSAEPLQHQLGERTAEAEKLKQDVKRLETELAMAQSAARARPGGPQTNSSTGSPAPPGPPEPPTVSRPSAAGPTSLVAPAAGAPATGTTPVKFAPTATSAPTTAPGSTSTDPHGATGTDPAVSEPSYFMTPPEAPARPAWHWALGSFVVALALGYALGWQMLDRRIRRKYGGLRIY